MCLCASLTDPLPSRLGVGDANDPDNISAQIGRNKCRPVPDGGEPIIQGEVALESRSALDRTGGLKEGNFPPSNRLRNDDGCGISGGGLQNMESVGGDSKNGKPENPV